MIIWARVSQFRLGEMVECGQGHIGKLEKGEHYPKLPTLYKISEALDISVSDILAESPPSSELARLCGTSLSTVSHAVAKSQKNPAGKSWYVGVWTCWSNREYKEYFGEAHA